MHDVLPIGPDSFCQIGAVGSSWPLTPNLRTSGGFNLYCELGSDVDSCGLPGCGGLVLTGNGIIYQAELVVIEGPYPEFAGDDIDVPCSISNGQRGAGSQGAGSFDSSSDAPQGARQHSKEVQELLAAANSTQRGVGSRQAGTVDLGGWLYTYSGPVTIHSKTHETKWKEGWVEFTVVESGYPNIPLAELARLESIFGTLPRVDSKEFNTYRFQFLKSRDRF